MNYDIYGGGAINRYFKKNSRYFCYRNLIISIFLYRALLIKEIDIVQKRQGLFIPLELLISGVWIQSDKKQLEFYLLFLHRDILTKVIASAR